MCEQTFVTALKRLQSQGYITRHAVHKYVQYHITQDGIRLLHDINIALDQQVKAIIQGS